MKSRLLFLVIVFVSGLQCQATSQTRQALFSTNGKKILIKSDNSAELWDATSGHLVKKFDGGSAVFSSDGKGVLTVSKGDISTLWDAATGTLLKNFKRFESVVLSPDDKKFLTVSESNTANLWDAASGSLLKKFDGSVRSAFFSPDGQKIFTASDDRRTLTMWNSVASKLLTELNTGGRPAVFSTDGKKILTHHDSVAQVWDVVSGILLTELKGSIKGVDPAVFRSHRVLIKNDHTDEICDANSDAYYKPTPGDHHDWAMFSPDGATILTIDFYSTKPWHIRVWNVNSGQLLTELKGYTQDVNSVVFSPDGKKILTTEDSVSRVWAVESGRLVIELKGSRTLTLFVITEEVESAVFSPDGKRILTKTDRADELWDATSGSLLKKVALDEAPFDKVVVFSPDLKKILTVFDDRAEIWDVVSGEKFRLLTNTGNSRATFSPDSQTISIMSTNDIVTLWDTNTGKLLYTLVSH